ncbi:hypothetical protein [Streptomyces bottropensis]
MEAMNAPTPFENGGILRPGVTLAANTSGQPEPVLRPDELEGDAS